MELPVSTLLTTYQGQENVFSSAFCRSCFIAALLSLFVTDVFAGASSLEKEILVLITQKYLSNFEPKPELTLKMLASEHVINAVCDSPELSLIGPTIRPLGNRTILAKCGPKRSYIRVNIKAVANYWVVKETIQPSKMVEKSNLMLKKGTLDGLPADLIFDQEQIVGRVATRLIKSGQPISEGQLRKHWVITVGQEINITAKGNGFHIISSAKSLNNAAVDEQLRIRTRSGQVITATATGRATATINLGY